MSRAETIQQLRDQREDIQQHLSTIVDDELPPELKERVRRVLNDLATSDISMALLDLAQLSRTMMMGIPSNAGRAPAPDEVATMPIIIYGEDGMLVTEQCHGPNSDGECPRASPTGAAACSGRWIMASGWRFRVAPDAESCPAGALGLNRPPPVTAPSSPIGRSPITNAADLFVSEVPEHSTEGGSDVVEEAYRQMP